MWRSCIEASYGLKPVYLILNSGAQEIMAGLPVFVVGGALSGRRLCTLPCTHFCNPLVSNDEHLRSLIEACLQLRYSFKASRYEMRLDSEPSWLERTAVSVNVSDYCTRILDIDLKATSSVVSIRVVSREQSAKPNGAV
jgi:hypothetical protein